MKNFNLAWKYLKKYVVIYTIALVVITALSAVGILFPILRGTIIRDVWGYEQTHLIWRYMGYIFALLIASEILRFLCIQIFERVSQNVMEKMRIDMYEKLQGLDFDFYDKTKIGDIMTRMTGDVDVIRHFIAWSVYGGLVQVAILITALVFMFLEDVRFAVGIFLLLPIVLWLSYKFYKEVRPAYVEIRHRFSRLNSVVQENISGNRIVRAFAKEDYETEKFDTENDKFQKSMFNLNTVNRRYMPWVSNAGGLLTIFILVTGSIFVVYGYFDVATLVVLQGMLWMIVSPLSMIPNILNDSRRFGASAEKINELFDSEPKIVGAPKPFPKAMMKGKVVFENVSFMFEDADTLTDVSFVAGPGQTIGIIGPTGSGKSTLTSLISRFYDPDKGKIRIDDVNIRYYDVRQLRSNIAIAHQEIFLFSDTIAENIAYGSPDVDLKRVQEVAMAADADGFISRMPEGYETIVGERGVGLSGGQKQRIALARALLKNPAILILDDTTSSVDMETEKFIFNMLKQHHAGSTTFIIAHRISSIMKADMILVMENGKIIERGTHDELIKLGGYYYSVFENQCGDFNVEAGE